MLINICAYHPDFYTYRTTVYLVILDFVDLYHFVVELAAVGVGNGRLWLVSFPETICFTRSSTFFMFMVISSDPVDPVFSRVN